MHSTSDSVLLRARKMNTRHGVHVNYNHREFVDALRDALGLAPIFRADRVTIRAFAERVFPGQVSRKPVDCFHRWEPAWRFQQSEATSRHNSRERRVRP